MPNRSCLFLLLSLTLSCRVSAQHAAVQIKIYDDADLSPGTRQQFVTRLENILVGAGVSARVSLCGRAIACETDGGESRRLLIRVTGGQARTMSNAQKPPLGQSLIGPNGGDYAFVFLPTVKDRAAEADISWVTVLAHAAAHEIGHLLLGNGSHTPMGLMKATWDHNDFERMNQKCLHFSDEQARQLALRYGETEAVHSRVAGVIAGQR